MNIPTDTHILHPSPHTHVQMRVFLGFLIPLVTIVIEHRVLSTDESTTWQYNMDIDASHVFTQYTIQETQPRAALMCPKGFFISELTYRFGGPTKKLLKDSKALPAGNEESSQGPMWGNGNSLTLLGALRQWKQIHESGKSGDEMLRYSLDEPVGNKGSLKCSPLIGCVGYQACLFHFATEFCLNDPYPGYRKNITLRIMCEKDALFYGYLQRAGIDLGGESLDWMNQVVFLKYKSQTEKGIIDYAQTDLHFVRQHESQVFGGTCPDLQHALDNGYFGTCVHEPSPTAFQDNMFWKVLGRVSSRQCHEELQQIFCAYSYNPTGDCAPPFLVRKTDGAPLIWPFNKQTIPENKERPDLTNYRKLYHHPHMGLIPARLGFVIMAHASGEAAFQLLELIYSREHIYVFHIDYRADHTREDLLRRIKIGFSNATNIRVLEKERSFVTSWGSFQILRGELEGFEELLRMGVWDFAFVLSGSDLPLRGVDDLAATMAPHRGSTFLKMYTVASSSTSVQSVWHTCDEHLFKVKPRRHVVPVYTHSAWVAMSRNAAQLLTSQWRGSALDSLHFALYTYVIPDESYLGTLLLSTPLKDSVVNGYFHFMKPFEKNNILKLCRHTNEADTCGQGPGILKGENDVSQLRFASHKFFFARKFNTSSDDVTRGTLMADYRNNFYRRKMMAPVVTKNILRGVARKVTVKLGFPADSLESVDNWRVVPSMKHSDVCCRPAGIMGGIPADQHLLWIDFTVNNNGSRQKARAALEARPNYRCYPGGSVRAMHVTTRTDTKRRPKYDGSPFPTLPAGVATIWLRLYFVSNVVTQECSQKQKSLNRSGLTYISLPSKEHMINKTYDVTTYVKVKDALGVTRCANTLFMQVKPKDVKTKSTTVWFSRQIRCRKLTSGTWTVLLEQVFAQSPTKRPHPYTITVELANETSADIYEREVADRLDRLWFLRDAMIVEEDFDKYYQTMFTERNVLGKHPSDVSKDGTVSTQAGWLAPRAARPLAPPRTYHPRRTVSEVSALTYREAFVACHFIMFVVYGLGVLFIYNLCLSNRKTMRSAVRRVAFNKASLLVAVLLLGLVLYYFGGSVLTPEDSSGPQPSYAES